MGIRRTSWALTVAATALAVTASSAASGASSVGTGQQLDKFRGWPTFHRVTVMSPDSALTVGSVEVENSCCQPMSQRWDGNDWTYSSPRVDGEGAFLGVDSLSETDAWAVGYGYLSQRALIEHWDGHRWRVADSGSQAHSVYLNDVAMVSPNDVWAVGTYYWGEGGQTPAVMHWDGTSWTRLPDPFSEGSLETVEAVAADDIWATGLYSGGVWHWDGTAWSQFANPLDGYFSMSAASANDVWLAGQLGGQGFAHWNGQNWTYVDSPALGVHDGQLWDVTAVSKKNAWAVGNTYVDDNGQPDRAVIEHWNGHKWAVIPCPHSQDTYDMLTAVGASSATDVWAIGTSGADPLRERGQRFMLHWDGTKWTRYRP